MIALIIRLTSDGPILFKQRRRGWDGKPFTIYKFRTMQLHTEPPGQLTQARINDHRFTAIGRWLRKTSLDELPQLYNVLQGRMSLVGPRPHAIEHDNFYEKHIEGYLRRHRVKPGITGWAQINDLRGEVQELEEMSRRVKHDLYYIEHWSLWFDVRIILATVLKIFFSKKAW
jgi:putative colanic acid biosynthesis UDP-glucose lipid carrier transferase